MAAYEMGRKDPQDSERSMGVFEGGSSKSDQYAEGQGDIQVLKRSDTGDDDSLKMAEDNKTVLIPQPSDDPDDVLNWSRRKKYTVLVSLVFASLLTDFGMTWGSVLFQAQAPSFNMSVDATANSISGGLFLQGPGGIVAVPLIQRFGRLPILFWSQFLAAITVMLAAVSPNYAAFTAFRALQGFVNTAPQVVGLSVVHDMFFFHERVKYVNLWAFCLLGGPFLGPFIAAWLIQAVSWRADYGILASLHGMSTLIVVMLGDETLYDRNNRQRRAKPAGFLGRLKLLVGIAGYQVEGRPHMTTILRDIGIIQIKPQIFFLTVCYVMTLIAWVIGVNTTISQLVIPPPYSFSQSAVALIWIAPMIGALIGEIWGHWFNDWLQARYIRTHGGKYVLENRLWGAYAPSLAGFCGLILYGQTLQHTLHWIVLLIAWAFIAFAMISATTAVSAYCLDAFPNHASLVASIINMWRTTGGFCVVYFQVKWINTSGPGVSFGCQAMVLGVAFIAGVVTTQVWGQKWRASNPPPAAEN